MMKLDFEISSSWPFTHLVLLSRVLRRSREGAFLLFVSDSLRLCQSIARARMANCTIRQPRCRRVYCRPHGTAPLRHCAAAQLYGCTIVQPRNPTFSKLLEAARMDSQTARNDRRQQLYKGVWILLSVRVTKRLTVRIADALLSVRVNRRPASAIKIDITINIKRPWVQPTSFSDITSLFSYLFYQSLALSGKLFSSDCWSINRFILSLREYKPLGHFWPTSHCTDIPLHITIRT